MTERTSFIIFASVWWLLIGIAVVAQVMADAKPHKRRAGLITNTLIVTPFVLVLGLFFLGRYFGTYEGTANTRAVGFGMIVPGLIGYTASHFYLRKNWSLSASIKEGHVLVTGGPYRFVRHPMYSFMMLIVIGSGFLVDNYSIAVSTVMVGVAYSVRAREEEGLLQQEFPEYAEYAKGTKKLIPGIW